MPEIQSPCLSCSLKDYSKDNPTCRDCNARCDYIKIIDGATPATHSESVKKRASSNKLKQAELYIQEACEKHFINLDDLKSQRYAGGLGDIKIEITSTLYHEYKLTMKEIAHMFGKSENAIWMTLQRKPKKDEKFTPETVDEAKADITALEEASSSHPKPDPSPLTIEDTAPPDMKVVCFSLRDHPDLYDYLVRAAKTSFRKPEDYILYLINKEREGIDEEKETLQPDTG